MFSFALRRAVAPQREYNIAATESREVCWRDYLARAAARSLRMTSVTTAAARHAAMMPSCHTGPQSDIPSAPEVQERK
jgi:hypothetical protein